VRVAPKKLREVLARFVGDSSDDENRAMFLLFRLLHHTCGALNSINFRNVIWHGFASAHEIDRLGAFAALLDALLLNLRHFGTIWIGCDSIAPPIHEPLAPLVFSGTTPTLSAVEFRALVSQAPLVHRASEQDRVYDGMFQLFRSNQRRDFAAVLFTTLEASLRVHYVRVNAAAFGSDMVEFQLDYDSLFISFAMLLNDTLFSKESADDGTGDYAYSFRSGDRNLLLERLPGDVLASLRELVFELELRDRLAHGLLQSDADISDDVMQAQWALLIALLQCRFEPLEVDALLARQHVPSFGVKRTLALALQRLERTESQMSFEAFYRALDTDALLVHECHGQLARICKNMCDARVLTDAAVANLPPDSSSNDGDSVAVPKHLALFRDAVHGAVYVRSAQLVRNWLSECEATRGNVASVRLARVEILSAQLLDCARRATWARFNLLAYHSGLLVRTQRERDLFGGIGRASVLRRDDERLVNLIQQD
jgi:hypothetical protein